MNVHKFPLLIRNPSCKRPKIKLDVLKANKTKGGLRLVDITAKLKSLKIGWLFNMDPFMVNLRESMVPNAIGTLFWYCNLKPHEASPHVNTTSKFWHQVIEAWFEMSFKSVNEIEDRDLILNQIIWYNSLIRVDNKIMVNNVLINGGLIYISDLVNMQLGAFKSFDEIKINFPTITWFLHCQIVKAIPAAWKNVLIHTDAENEINYPENLYDQLAKMEKPIGFIYNMLIDRNDSIVCIYNKIASKIGLNRDTDLTIYLKAFNSINKVTNITKYRDFQYRLLVNAIHCNNRLYHWRLTDSKYCDICAKPVIQDVKHLLYDCSNAKKIWEEINEFFVTCQLDEVQFSYSRIFLNNIHPKVSHVCNFILLVAKQMIFAYKCLGKKLNTTMILLKIEELHNIESEIARKKNKMKIHCKKWEPIYGSSETETDLTDAEYNMDQYAINYFQ